MWQEKDKQLYKQFKFRDFKEAFSFMTKVAALAEVTNHHPRWQNQYNKVEIWLSTHSSGKITSKDHQLAEAIDGIPTTHSKANIHKAKLYTDGGSRGNPGHSAIAYVICDLDNNVVEKSGSYIGIATNNQAEYNALLFGLKRARELRINDLEVMMDSELVVKQMNGHYKIKNELLIPIYEKVKELVLAFENIRFGYVPRALNKEADGEVNRILDEQASAK